MIFKSSFELAPVIVSTSFEEPVIANMPLVGFGKYFDTGDASVAHDLVNNGNTQLPVDVAGVGNVLGVDARYVPYNTPSTGLTDGDFCGVSDFVDTNDPDVIDNYTDGVQGYQMSDTDGIMVLEFDVVDLTLKTNNSVSIDYFIRGFEIWEFDGDINSSATDSFKIYVKDLTNMSEITFIDTTGFDVDNLGITGQWTTGMLNLPDNIMMQLVVELRSNGSTEAVFLDNVVVRGE